MKLCIRIELEFISIICRLNFVKILKHMKVTVRKIDVILHLFRKRYFKVSFDLKYVNVQLNKAPDF